jgi:putative tricarboxylic transport membrane protein
VGLRSLNRDTVIAILLLVFCSFLAWSTLYIRSPDYGTLAPSAWPRMVLAALALFSLIYLLQSLSGRFSEAADAPKRPPGLLGFVQYYRNPIVCFATYFVFLATLPILGALIGGTLLVFVLLNVLDGWSLNKLLKHGAIAVISMGSMWLLFTFGLRVILPQGEIFSVL